MLISRTVHVGVSNDDHRNIIEVGVHLRQIVPCQFADVVGMPCAVWYGVFGDRADVAINLIGGDVNKGLDWQIFASMKNIKCSVQIDLQGFHLVYAVVINDRLRCKMKHHLGLKVLQEVSEISGIVRQIALEVFWCWRKGFVNIGSQFCAPNG